jgi:archaellum component FlaC
MAAVTQEPQMGLTFEKVWAAFMESREKFDKQTERFDKMSERVDRMSEHIDKVVERFDRQTEKFDKMSERVDRTSENVDKMAERFDRQTEKFDKQSEQVDRTSEHVDKVLERFDRQTEKFDKMSENLGGLNRSMGELIETLIAARLWEKFNEYPYDLQRAYQRVPLFDENNRVLTDIDILLSNGEYVMAVEVKRELDREKDVDRHLKRMELIRKYPPAETKGKKLLGAMAGGVVDADVRDYAHSAGLFVLELTGESVKLVERPREFTPREW